MALREVFDPKKFTFPGNFAMTTDGRAVKAAFVPLNICNKIGDLSNQTFKRKSLKKKNQFTTSVAEAVSQQMVVVTNRLKKVAESY